MTGAVCLYLCCVSQSLTLSGPRLLLNGNNKWTSGARLY